MKKSIKLLIIIIGLVLITGCAKIPIFDAPPTPTPSDKPDKEVEITITHDEVELMEIISNIVFDVEKENQDVASLTDEKKSEIARQLINKFVEGKGYTDVTGTEMLNEFKKYFGTNQTINFTDIKCFVQHNNSDEQILMYFDKALDKYVENNKHPGHGGGGVKFIGSEFDFDNVKVEGNKYIYNVKVLYYGDALCHDVGPCDYGKGYKSYTDAKNGRNSLIDIDNSKEYWITYSDFPSLELDKLMKDYRDRLDTYSFIFEKENNNLVFKEYKKA